MYALVCPAAARPTYFGQVAPAQQQQSGVIVKVHNRGSSSQECPASHQPATASDVPPGLPLLRHMDSLLHIAHHAGKQMQPPPQRHVPACCSPGCRPLQTVRPPEHAQWCRALLRGLSASSGHGSQSRCSLQMKQRLGGGRADSMAVHTLPTLEVAAGEVAVTS